MKAAYNTAIQHSLCKCDEAYTSRGLKAPDCPLHAYGIDEVMDIYASQFRIIERLIEKGVWVEIQPIIPTQWYYTIYQFSIDDPMEPFAKMHTNTELGSYTAALSDAIEYLRPLGYLEGVV
jgi:hypothetical protein